MDASNPSQDLGLLEALRSTGAVRRFTDRPVPDAALYRVLDTARFAPSGGNRQGWSVVVVKDPGLRNALGECYASAARRYLAMVLAGLVPWAPRTDRDKERAALGGAKDIDLLSMGEAGELAAHFPTVPVMLALLADLSVLAASDRELDRYSIVGGASVYPFAWSVLLAARAEGLAGVLTTMATSEEPEVRRLLGAREGQAVAGIIVLGHPEATPRRLRRRAVEDFTTYDTVDGPAFAPDGG